MSEPNEWANALAAVTHAECLADWERRPPGSAITQHGVDKDTDKDTPK